MFEISDTGKRVAQFPCAALELSWQVERWNSVFLYNAENDDVDKNQFVNMTPLVGYVFIWKVFSWD